jgi:nucleoside phosphorylase
MTLIYTALQSELQSIIEVYNLTKISSNFKIYKNDNLIAVIGGIGEENTKKTLQYIFKNYKISKAINIGIAGCSDENIKIGDIFCTNKQLDNMKSLRLKTVKNPQLKNQTKQNQTTLYDMEGFFFEEICLKYLKEKDIFIFKIVSDYLSDKKLQKEFVKQLIYKNIKSIQRWI